MKHSDRQPKTTESAMSTVLGILIAAIILVVSGMYDTHSSYKYVPTPKEVSKQESK